MEVRERRQYQRPAAQGTAESPRSPLSTRFLKSTHQSPKDSLLVGTRPQRQCAQHRLCSSFGSTRNPKLWAAVELLLKGTQTLFPGLLQQDECGVAGIMPLS